MTATTTPSREAIIGLIAKQIEHDNAEWQAGRCASPSQLDYVLDADRILTTSDPAYIGSTPEGREFVADVLYEDCGEKYATAEEIAAYLYDTLTAE